MLIWLLNNNHSLFIRDNLNIFRDILYIEKQQKTVHSRRYTPVKITMRFIK
jgi:uncharacterized membrane protein (UPF0127 family)